MSGPWEKYQPVTIENSTGKEGPWAKYATVEDPIKSAIDKSPTAGLLDAAGSLASGAVAAPVAGIAGLVQGAGNVVRGFTDPTFQQKTSAGDAVRNVQDALTYEPKTTLGKGLVKAVSYPFQKLADIADVAGAKTTDVAGPTTGAAVNTALQAVPLILGRVKPGAAAGASEAAAKLKNATRDTAVANAKEAGFSLPPTQVNPSPLNKTLEGFGGKIKTAQDLSLKNQPVSNDIVRQDLGLPKDAPLTKEALAGIRKEAGQSYERVRSSGVVTADPLYGEALDKVAAPFERAAKDFPDAARTDVLDAVKASRRDSFDAGSAIDHISILRDKADAAYAAKDKKLGGAYKGIANALEEQLGRHLEVSGAPAESLQAFRDARQTIAKTYTVEKHLKPDGNVDARGLAADLAKNKPLTGGLRTVAEFAANFPKAAQMPEKIGGVPTSPLDAFWGQGSMATGIMSGHPALAAGAIVPYTRPLLRKMLASQGYQNTFVNSPRYGPSMLSRLQELQNRPAVPMFEMAEGQQQ